jgi:hypothetical protein
MLNLTEYVKDLKAGPVAPLPATEEWKDHVHRISVPGRSAEITDSHFRYWLEVLPPKWMHGGDFCFAEGAEPLRFFWEDEAGRLFCRQLTRWPSLSAGKRDIWLVLGGGSPGTRAGGTGRQDAGGQRHCPRGKS